MANRAPRVWAYNRVSSGQQELTLDTQLDLAKRVAANLVETQGCVVERNWAFNEVESATDVRWNQRPQFAALLEHLSPGDHLIIFAQDRLDREEESLMCLKVLSQKNITLHQTRDGTSGPVMQTLNDRLLRMVYAMGSVVETHLRVQRTMNSRVYRKANGFVSSSGTAWGMRRQPARHRKGVQRPYIALVWDHHQCDLLREIRQRRDRGEAFSQIALDLDNRDERTPSGSRWVSWLKPSRKTRRKTAQPTGQKVSSAYVWYQRVLAAGYDIETCTTAQAMMAGYPVSSVAASLASGQLQATCQSSTAQ